MAPDGNHKVGAALVIGGGIAGIQAALDLAESGIKVYLVEKSSAIGGKMAQLDKTFPTNDCAMCIISPKLVECGRHLNIDVLTTSQVTAIRGQAGDFTVTVRRTPRYVDLAKCIACGDCERKCPESVPSEFNAGLSPRKAIFKAYPQAVPNAYAMDKRGMAPCRHACPTHQRAQGYIALIRERRFADAYRVIKEDNPFPSICGRVCNHKCEEACSRNLLEGPVSIMALKRFVADWMAAERQSGRAAPAKPVELPLDAPRVALVGSGPAGLTAAQDLALSGHRVTVFEALPVAGGMMRVGIPEYRLPAEVLQRDIDEILALGVELKLNRPVDKLDELFAEGYQAVFLAVGAHKSQRLEVEGEDLEGVLSGIDFLREINLGGKATGPLGRVAVIGGGNTAIDCARTAKRLGAGEVSIIYRRSRAEMPAQPEEVDEAEREGVKLVFLAAPTKITDRGGKVTGLTCVRMQLGEPDQSGRRRPVPIPGSEFDLLVDTVIAAIGQAPDLSLSPGLTLTRSGCAGTDDALATNLPGVFAGGDAVTGPAFVVDAIAAGHKAALGIENYLRGLRGEAPKPQPSYLPAVKLTQEEVSAKVDKGDIVLRQRVERTAVPVAQRLTNPFAECDLGLTEEQAVAEAERCLSCGICSECLECVYACGPKAIDHNDRECEQEINVGAVIVAAGYDVYDARLSEEFGHGRYPNVITSLQFERVLSASGPSQGHVQRPSDGQEPRRIAFLQCIGSRDQKHDYCSAVCCMYATKEAILAKEHLPGVDCQVFMVDMRAFGKNFDAYFERAKREYGVNYVRCRPSSLKEVPSSRNLLLRYQTEEGELREEEFDLVVLSVGMEPAQGTRELARTLGIELDSNGFCAVSEFTPLETSVPGIYVCGPFAEPMDIPDSVTQGSGAAANALALLAPARGTLVKPKEYPPEMDVSGQEPRVGIFVCHCGSNIAGVVDVEKVVEYAQVLPGVVHAQRNLFTCSQDTQENIKKTIAELGLNRVVVASCTPRTHEPIFQETMREAGLNPYYFEMANIRDQCSWVHSKEPREATVKAMDLLRMAVARARLLQPLRREPMELQHQALVIGGGPAGLTAALSLAGQGFAVSLVEREKELGGHLRHLPYSLQETGTREFLERLVRDVESHPLIRAFKDAEVLDASGFVGNFQSTVLTGRSSSNGDRQKVEIGHGVTIVATGAREYRGQEYLLGQAPQVITQQDLMERIAQGPASLAQAREVVMIQCVGPELGKEWYCSRLCCTVAINNALRVKELNPEATIYVLYKDIRTYGFREKLYTQAREKGIIFVRYTDAAPPQVAESAGRLTVKVTDPVLREELELSADLLVLATALVPSEGADSLAPLFKIPQTREGFFLEAHVKLRPVDFASEGIFLCGSAHYPKFLSESIAQGYAAAARAATILSKPQLMVGGVVAVVDETRCVGCLTCVRVCPYKVPRINSEKCGVGGLLGTAEIAVAQCQGCGVCAAECPAKAIQLLHYRDEQVLAKAEALFAEVCA